MYSWHCSYKTNSPLLVVMAYVCWTWFLIETHMLVSGPMCLVLGTLAGSLEVSVYYVHTFVYDIISQFPMMEWYLLILNWCSTEWICVQYIAFNLPWYISLSQPIVLEYIASANRCVFILSLSLPLCHTHTHTHTHTYRYSLCFTPCSLSVYQCPLIHI